MTGQMPIIVFFIFIIVAVQIFILVNIKKLFAWNERQNIIADAFKQKLDNVRQELQQNIQTGFKDLAEILTASQRNTFEVQDKRLAELSEQLSKRTGTLQQTVNERLEQMDKRLSSNSIESEQKLEAIRKTIEARLTSLREENSKKLDEMRATVDEKLQKTLEERISKSFNLVSERLEQVYKGLGEMQTLASGVGDLKKILSNVKTRGILGEIQLGSILEQIMSKEQYEENVAIKGSSERVEFAIKLPGDDNGIVYLPIDAKFPVDIYSTLLNAYDSGNKDEINEAQIQLGKSIKSFAKTIHTKYIEPPYTTDFGIMFLPFEGLYAEVVRGGLVEDLQREYKINIAGPTTMAALLNSLQLGFRTLAIQKHSSKVWNVLGAIKTEFDKFGDILVATQQRLTQANAELDKLVGVRTRAIQSKLRDIEKLPEHDIKSILPHDDTALDVEE